MAAVLNKSTGCKVFFVYTQQDRFSIERNLGAVDYSYFFVMQMFLPLLKKLGPTFVVKSATDVAEMIGRGLVLENDAVLFCFTPPHRASLDLKVRIIPVFAWEYSTIPSEAWGNNQAQNWSYVLQKLGAAITHSRFAVAAVRRQMGSDYPVVSLPAPVWNAYSAYYKESATAFKRGRLIINNGVLLDSQLHGSNVSHCRETPSFIPGKHVVEVNGFVYTVVFNPADGRKNWGDFMSAFCYAFRDQPDAILIMKLVCSDINLACGVVWHEMKKLSPYRCRLIAIQGYMDSDAYENLVENSTYVINSSYGEGQCLPLMEFMSAGKPAIAPDHTAMADYISEKNAFVVRSNEEWTHWPHDPRLVLRAFRYRISWESLRKALLASFDIAALSPEKYAAMAQAANEALEKHCSQAVISEELADFLRGREMLSSKAVSWWVVMRVHLFLLGRNFVRNVNRTYAFLRRKLSGY